MSTSVFDLPHEPRQIRATEAVVQRIYRAARVGLKGSNLAYAAGLLPEELHTLTEFDPLARHAVEKARADGHREVAEALHTAALNGDVKAATIILERQHGWVQQQQVNISVEQQISITHALALAQQRTIDLLANPDPPPVAIGNDT